MQRLRIRHTTEYGFSVPVALGPHRLMVRPREGHDVHIESSLLEIFPAYHLTWHRDVFDNSVAVATFTENSDRLCITSEVVIQHYVGEPLDFIVEDYAVRYPFEYPDNQGINLKPYCQPNYGDAQSRVWRWLSDLGIDLESVETYVLLETMNKALAAQLSYRTREEPGVQAPVETLKQGSGSCRDYAALFVDTCRILGLASRFVSGYLHTPASSNGNGVPQSLATHAWAEVYLPGAGWKGFDPTSGTLTDSRHISVAVARHPEAVPPVAGSFSGPAGETPQMRVDVQVSARSS